VEAVFRAIGVVHVDAPDEVIKSSFDGVDGVVEIFPEFEDGLTGIDGFSHIILITYLHKHRGNPLRVKPKRLIKFGVPEEVIPEVGVFVTDSPDRPNPIGLSIVKLLGREGRFLKVSGLDLFNGTPVLDIKPYTPDRVVEDIKLPKWYTDLSNVLSRLGIHIV
jgi:tRNA-Thr(GGU) m(6)t(6)A37 methyltransferase TsaA